MRELIQILSSCPQQGPKETDDTWQRSTPPIYKLCCHLYGCWQYRSHQKCLEWLLSTSGSPRIRFAFFFFLERSVHLVPHNVHYKPLHLDAIMWTKIGQQILKYWKFHFYTIPAMQCDRWLWGDVLQHRWCVKLRLKVLGNSAPHLITAIISTDPYFPHYARESINVWRDLCDFQVWGWTEKPAFSLVKYRSKFA